MLKVLTLDTALSDFVTRLRAQADKLQGSTAQGDISLAQTIVNLANEVDTARSEGTTAAEIITGLENVTENAKGEQAYDALLHEIEGLHDFVKEHGARARNEHISNTTEATVASIAGTLDDLSMTDTKLNDIAKADLVRQLRASAASVATNGNNDIAMQLLALANGIKSGDLVAAAKAHTAALNLFEADTSIDASNITGLLETALLVDGLKAEIENPRSDAAKTEADVIAIQPVPAQGKREITEKQIAAISAITAQLADKRHKISEKHSNPDTEAKAQKLLPLTANLIAALGAWSSKASKGRDLTSSDEFISQLLVEADALTENDDLKVGRYSFAAQIAGLKEHFPDYKAVAASVTPVETPEPVFFDLGASKPEAASLADVVKSSQSPLRDPVNFTKDVVVNDLIIKLFGDDAFLPGQKQAFTELREKAAAAQAAKLAEVKGIDLTEARAWVDRSDGMPEGIGGFDSGFMRPLAEAEGKKWPADYLASDLQKTCQTIQAAARIVYLLDGSLDAKQVPSMKIFPDSSDVQKAYSALQARKTEDVLDADKDNEAFAAATTALDTLASDLDSSNKYVSTIVKNFSSTKKTARAFLAEITSALDESLKADAAAEIPASLLNFTGYSGTATGRMETKVLRPTSINERDPELIAPRQQGLFGLSQLDAGSDETVTTEDVYTRLFDKIMTGRIFEKLGDSHGVNINTVDAAIAYLKSRKDGAYAAQGYIAALDAEEAVKTGYTECETFLLDTHRLMKSDSATLRESRDKITEKMAENGRAIISALAVAVIEKELGTLAAETAAAQSLEAMMLGVKKSGDLLFDLTTFAANNLPQEFAGDARVTAESILESVSQNAATQDAIKAGLAATLAETDKNAANVKDLIELVDLHNQTLATEEASKALGFAIDQIRAGQGLPDVDITATIVDFVSDGRIETADTAQKEALIDALNADTLHTNEALSAAFLAEAEAYNSFLDDEIDAAARKSNEILARIATVTPIVAPVSKLVDAPEAAAETAEAAADEITLAQAADDQSTAIATAYTAVMAGLDNAIKDGNLKAGVAATRLNADEFVNAMGRAIDGFANADLNDYAATSQSRYAINALAQTLEGAARLTTGDDGVTARKGIEDLQTAMAIAMKAQADQSPAIQTEFGALKNKLVSVARKTTGADKDTAEAIVGLVETATLSKHNAFEIIKSYRLGTTATGVFGWTRYSGETREAYDTTVELFNSCNKIVTGTAQNEEREFGKLDSILGSLGAIGLNQAPKVGYVSTMPDLELVETTFNPDMPKTAEADAQSLKAPNEDMQRSIDDALVHIFRTFNPDATDVSPAYRLSDVYAAAMPDNLEQLNAYVGYWAKHANTANAQLAYKFIVEGARNGITPEAATFITDTGNRIMNDIAAAQKLAADIGDEILKLSAALGVPEDQAKRTAKTYAVNNTGGTYNPFVLQYLTSLADADEAAKKDALGDIVQMAVPARNNKLAQNRFADAEKRIIARLKGETPKTEASKALSEAQMRTDIYQNLHASIDALRKSTGKYFSYGTLIRKIVDAGFNTGTLALLDDYATSVKTRKSKESKEEGLKNLHYFVKTKDANERHQIRQSMLAEIKSYDEWKTNTFYDTRFNNAIANLREGAEAKIRRDTVVRNFETIWKQSGRTPGASRKISEDAIIALGRMSDLRLLEAYVTGALNETGLAPDKLAAYHERLIKNMADLTGSNKETALGDIRLNGEYYAKIRQTTENAIMLDEIKKNLAFISEGQDKPLNADKLLSYFPEAQLPRLDLYLHDAAKSNRDIKNTCYADLLEMQQEQDPEKIAEMRTALLEPKDTGEMPNILTGRSKASKPDATAKATQAPQLDLAAAVDETATTPNETVDGTAEASAPLPGAKRQPPRRRSGPQLTGLGTATATNTGADATATSGPATDTTTGSTGNGTRPRRPIPTLDISADPDASLTAASTGRRPRNAPATATADATSDTTATADDNRPRIGQKIGNGLLGFFLNEPADLKDTSKTWRKRVSESYPALGFKLSGILATAGLSVIGVSEGVGLGLVGTSAYAALGSAFAVVGLTLTPAIMGGIVVGGTIGIISSYLIGSYYQARRDSLAFSRGELTKKQKKLARKSEIQGRRQEIKNEYRGFKNWPKRRTKLAGMTLQRVASVLPNHKTLGAMWKSGALGTIVTNIVIGATVSMVARTVLTSVGLGDLHESVKNGTYSLLYDRAPAGLRASLTGDFSGGLDILSGGHAEITNFFKTPDFIAAKDILTQLASETDSASLKADITAALADLQRGDAKSIAAVTNLLGILANDANSPRAALKLGNQALAAFGTIDDPKLADAIDKLQVRTARIKLTVDGLDREATTAADLREQARLFAADTAAINDVIAKSTAVARLETLIKGMAASPAKTALLNDLTALKSGQLGVMRTLVDDLVAARQNGAARDVVASLRADLQARGLQSREALRVLDTIKAIDVPVDPIAAAANGRPKITAFFENHPSVRPLVAGAEEFLRTNPRGVHADYIRDLLAKAKAGNPQGLVGLVDSTERGIMWKPDGSWERIPGFKGVGQAAVTARAAIHENLYDQRTVNKQFGTILEMNKAHMSEPSAEAVTAQRITNLRIQPVDKIELAKAYESQGLRILGVNPDGSLRVQLRAPVDTSPFAGVKSTFNTILGQEGPQGEIISTKVWPMDSTIGKAANLIQLHATKYGMSPQQFEQMIRGAQAGDPASVGRVTSLSEDVMRATNGTRPFSKAQRALLDSIAKMARAPSSSLRNS